MKKLAITIIILFILILSGCSREVKLELEVNESNIKIQKTPYGTNNIKFVEIMLINTEEKENVIENLNKLVFNEIKTKKGKALWIGDNKYIITVDQIKIEIFEVYSIYRYENKYKILELTEGGFDFLDEIKFLKKFHFFDVNSSIKIIKQPDAHNEYVDLILYNNNELYDFLNTLNSLTFEDINDIGEDKCLYTVSFLNESIQFLNNNIVLYRNNYYKLINCDITFLNNLQFTPKLT